MAAATPRDDQLQTIDTLANLTTGQGGRNDSRAPSARHFFHYGRTYPDLLAAYRSSWMAAQIVEIPALEMTREWRTFELEDPKEQEAVENIEDRLCVAEKVREAIQWADLFGGGALLMGLDGTGELNEELDPGRVKPNSLMFLHTLDAQTLIPHDGINTALVMDPSSEQFMQPEFYTIAAARIEYVHHSRIVRFPGIALPWREMQRNRWWGGSRVERSFDAIADAETVIGGVAELVTEAKIDVYGIPDLMHLLSTPEGETTVKRRIQLADSIKSIWNSVIIDAAEDYDQKQNALVQGLAPLIEQFLVIISAASGIPVTKLLGTSAKGMSATGEGDLRNFYDAVAARQQNYLKPRLNRLDEVLLRSAIGKKPNDVKWRFNSLWQMSESEEAEIELKRANTDKIYFDLGVVDEVTIAKQLKAAGTYVAIDDKFISDLEGEIELEENRPPPVLPAFPVLPTPLTPPTDPNAQPGTSDPAAE
jgi:hypothetical protein